MRRRDLLLATPLLCANPGLFAQTYPARPIRYIVPVVAGVEAILLRAPLQNDGAGRSMAHSWSTTREAVVA